MARVTKHVEVRQIVAVTVDEEKFNDAFMAEFRAYFFPFYSLDDHICHLGQMFARGILGDVPTFIEGYGPVESMGISLVDVPQAQEEDIVVWEDCPCCIQKGGAA